MEPFVVFYVPCPSVGEAKRIGRVLLEKHLVACANVVPIQSLYWWEGRIADDSETVLLAKTTAESTDKVVSEIRATHPYKVPCIARFEGKANEEYVEWLRDSVKEKAED